MSYYMGDFYGARMAGDPGFFGFLGGLAKSAVGMIPGIGAPMARVLERVGGGGATRAISVATPGIVRRAGGIIARHPVLSAAGAAGVIGLGAGAGAEALMAGGGACPKGFHPCKSRHGCRRGACVRNRRMHVTNPRALRRAIRRASGFAHLARKVMRFTSPRPPRGRAYFRARKRKR